MIIKTSQYWYGSYTIFWVISLLLVYTTQKMIREWMLNCFGRSKQRNLKKNILIACYIHELYQIQSLFHKCWRVSNDCWRFEMSTSWYIAKCDQTQGRALKAWIAIKTELLALQIHFTGNFTDKGVIYNIPFNPYQESSKIICE